MPKRISTIIVFLLLLAIAATYAFRLSITQWILAPKLSEFNIKLECLDWSMTANLSLHAKAICLIYQKHTFELQDIELSHNNLVINNATLTLSSNTNSTVNTTSQSTRNTEGTLKKTFNLALPKTRPLLQIKTLSIQSDLLTEPVHLTLSENTLNHFTVEGDFSATLKLTNDQISGSFQPNTDKIIKSLLQEHLITDPNAQITILSNATKLKNDHKFVFNGKKLQIQSQLDVFFPYTNNALCQSTLAVKGALLSNFNLVSQVFIFDTKDLIAQAKFDRNCLNNSSQSEYQDFIQAQAAFDWQFNIPEIISLYRTKLTIPKLHLISRDDNIYQILVKNISVDLDQPNTLTGEISAQASTKNIQNIRLNTEINGSTLTGRYQLAANHLPKFTGINSEETTVSGDVTLANLFSHTGLTPIGEISGQIDVVAGKVSSYQFKHYKGKLIAQLDQDLNLNTTLVSQITSSHIELNKLESLKLNGVANTIDAQINLNEDEPAIKIKATSTLESLQTPQATLEKIRINSEASYQANLKASHKMLIEGISIIATHQLSDKEHPFEITIPKQKAEILNAFIKKIAPIGQLNSGHFSGNIIGDAHTKYASITLQLDQVSGLYDGYLLDGLDTQLQAQYQNEQLILDKTNFSLSELRAGIIINKLQGELALRDHQPFIQNVKGNLFGGYFSINQYLIGSDHQTMHVRFDDIEASQIMVLYNDPSIQINGKITGALPIHLKGNKIEIKQGKLSNQNQASLIIENNEAFNAIKSQQKELSQVLGLLENLDIQQLDSKIKLSPNGELTLNVKLKGYNKKQAQEVNFNYNHEENVFTLLRALRLSDEITQKVEQKYRNE